MPFAPVGGTICAASPARNKRPNCSGSTTKLRMPVTPFCRIRALASAAIRPCSPGAYAIRSRCGRHSTARYPHRAALQIEPRDARRAHAVQTQNRAHDACRPALRATAPLRPGFPATQRDTRARRCSVRLRGMDCRDKYRGNRRSRRCSRNESHPYAPSVFTRMHWPLPTRFLPATLLRIRSADRRHLQIAARSDPSRLPAGRRP